MLLRCSMHNVREVVLKMGEKEKCKKQECHDKGLEVHNVLIIGLKVKDVHNLHMM